MVAARNHHPWLRDGVCVENGVHLPLAISEAQYRLSILCERCQPHRNSRSRKISQAAQQHKCDMKLQVNHSGSLIFRVPCKTSCFSTGPPLTLSPPMIGDPPIMVFLLHHESQLLGPPPLFCHTDIAVPTTNGASDFGIDVIRRRKPSFSDMLRINLDLDLDFSRQTRRRRQSKVLKGFTGPLVRHQSVRH